MRLLKCKRACSGGLLLTFMARRGLNRPRPTQPPEPRRLEGAGSGIHLSEELAPGPLMSNGNLRRRRSRRGGELAKKTRDKRQAPVLSNKIALGAIEPA
jgi:hypothetical protein